MKFVFVVMALILFAVLNIGYYEKVVEADLEIVPFIKKHPTFQVEFINIHANDGDYRKVERLTAEQRQWMISYCRYRLGIDTELKTQKDVEVCSKK